MTTKEKNESFERNKNKSTYLKSKHYNKTEIHSDLNDPKFFLFNDNDENENFFSHESQINKNHKKLDERKTILKEVLYNSFAQAILRLVFTPHLVLKLLLLILVLSSSGLALYLVIQSILTYFTYQVSTTSRTIYETPTLFPKVTFCNVNPFTTEYAYNLTQMGISNGNDLNNDQKMKLGLDLKDILIECWFNLNPCSVEDFIWTYDNTYGNCYTFNSGLDSKGNKIDLKQSKIAGPAFGLQLTLYVNVYEKLMDNIDALGAFINIGNSSNSTYHLNNGILVSSGFQTGIVVDREFKSILPKPYSNCEIDSNTPKFLPDFDLYNLISQSEYSYSQQFCFVQCLQKQIIEKYNCSITYLPSIFKVNACDADLLWGILNSDKSLKGNFIAEVLISKICLPLCPLECDQNTYKTSLSTAQLNGNNNFRSWIKNNANLSSHFINRTIDEATTKESLVLVKIFYENLSYTLTTESPQMNIVSLLASIGGNLGLFLGVSVFSIWEIIEVFVQISYFT